MQQEQWNEKLNEDILLTKIGNLERKLQVCFAFLNRTWFYIDYLHRLRTYQNLPLPIEASVMK